MRCLLPKKQGYLRGKTMLNQLKRRPILIMSCIIVLLGLGIVLVLRYTLFASAQAPAPRGVNCGTLYLHGYNGPAYDDKGKQETVRSIGDCFWNAYQHCHTATLTVHQMGVDTGTTSMFIVDQQQGQCVLTDTVQSYNANFGGSQSSFTTYTCAALIRRGNDLRFTGCGEVEDMLVSL